MIRKARKDDLNRILEIYDIAKSYMRKNGNLNQWNNNYPNEEILLNDINNSSLYVYENNNIIHAVFALIIGIDKTYNYIENGHWLSELTYGTLHRIASDQEERNIFNKIIEFAETKIDHLRIDTHKDNIIMQHVILKNGFKECGIIYISDGSPRIAYEKIKSLT